ncbi:MAG: aldehyde dehydrogenase family protein [Pirellulales bacterium]|nr:aldehyde dehydrogenase family protein [Pirellulales bacterium]
MSSPQKALNYIGGEWSWPDGAGAIKSINPADASEVVCETPESSAEELDRAVDAAAKAFSGWRRTPPPARAVILQRAGQILAERKQRIGELIAREAGKPVAEGCGDVQEAIDMAELAAGEGRRLYGDTAPSELPNKMCLTFREPIGVCGLITPWNFPVAIPAWKSFHALICGNTVVIKPASDTPMCGHEFVRALADAGLPPGVINLVQGRGSVVGEAMIKHPKIALISITGSTETGKHVAAECGRTGKRISLECGGKNAEIVMDDADLELAVDGALWGAFGTSGQRCTATSRLIVHEAVYDKMLEKIAKRAAKLRLGPGVDPTTDVGPLVNESQFKKVMEYIRVGKEEDKARLIRGGFRASGGRLDRGWFIEPTIFADVDRTMRIFKEEIFGPVLSVIKVGDLEEAVETLNDCNYGLSSSIYTRDINKALWAVREIEAGIVYVNGPTIGAEVHMPFGGVKGTGNGHREAGKVGLDIFTEWKTVYIDYSGKLQRAQIDTDEILASGN